MGLLSTEVEIGLSNGRIISYYENLGYKIPRWKNLDGRYTVKRGTKIIVKIEDLNPNSAELVNVECDCCKKKKAIHYFVYNRTVKTNIADGKYICPKCMTKLNRGTNHHSWNPNLSQEDRELTRNTDECKHFIRIVLKRDNYTCQCCGKTSSSKIILHVHHLNGFNWHVDGRYDPENGITLCETCHSNFHLEFGYGNNTKEQFESWLGKALINLQHYDELPKTKKVYCIEENKIYNSAYELGKLWKIKNSRIYELCNQELGNESNYTVRGKHLVWYDNYLKMTKEEIENLLLKSGNNRQKRIICITTNKIFKNASEAGRYYGYDGTNIRTCCKGKLNYAGKLPDGTRLQWMYYDDYLNNMNSNLKEAS